MGSSKTKQTSNQQESSTHSYGYVNAPITPQMQDYRNQIDTAYNQTDPSIAFDYNQQRNRLNDRFDNPFGANYSPEVADAAKYAGQQELDQQQGQAYRGANFANQQGKLSALGAYADATAPKLVNTGSTGTSSGTSTTVQPFNWMGLINAGAQIGSAVLT